VNFSAALVASGLKIKNILQINLIQNDNRKIFILFTVNYIIVFQPVVRIPGVKRDFIPEL
jgi:hypothetical protein